MKPVGLDGKGEKKIMIAKKRDRCGRYHDHYNGDVGNHKKVNAVEIQSVSKDGNSWTSVECFELCPLCLKEFSDWLYNIQTK